MATASSCRRIGTTAERMGYASTGTKAVPLEGFERYCFRQLASSERLVQY